MRWLEANGIEYVFGVPSEKDIWLIRSLEGLKRIRYVLNWLNRVELNAK